MSFDLARLRSLRGAGAALWAPDAAVRVEPGRWVVLSGADSVDHNLALCHSSNGGEELRETLAEVTAAGVPATINLAGEALGDAQQLIDAGWICVGAGAFMANWLVQDASLDPPDPGVRRLHAEELGPARAIIEEAFGLPPELAEAALPDSATTAPDRSVWGAHDTNGQLVACLGAIRVEEALVVWKASTAVSQLRRGHNARLRRAVFADAAQSGAEVVLGHASAVGEAFNHSFGYEELERWQEWSRLRWVFAHPRLNMPAQPA
jgi:hypothetical protein